MSSRWILLRGLTRGNGHWGVFPDLLTEAGFDVELMEIPGNGTQFRKTTPTDPDEVLRDLKSRSRHVSSGQPYSLLGISLGGMMALKWAEIGDPQLSSVAVVNTSLHQCSSFYERLMPGQYLEILKAVSARDPVVREQIILRAISNRSIIAANELGGFSLFSKMHPISLVNLIRQLILANRLVIRTPFLVPVLIINSMGDRLVDPVCSERIAQEFDLSIATHESAGHDLPLDDPQWLVQMLI